MPRARFAFLNTTALAALLLGTACNDATAPTKGESPDAGAGLGQSVAQPDLNESATAGGGTALATPSAVQVGADTVAQIGVLGPDGLPESVPAGASSGDVVPGRYIVIFKDGVSDAPGLAKRLIADHRGTLRRTYKVFKGFSANLPAAAAEALRHNPNVDVVEPVRVVTTAATQYMATGSGRAWGLDRIDQIYRPLSGSMTYAHTGYGVTAYILDTGILANHGEFGGRARNVATVFGDAGSDCHGHGTHVAGIVGGKTYGVAKQVQLRGVKVLDCTRATTNEAIASGIDWVYRYHVNPAVANISIQTCSKTGICTPDASIDRATTNLANSGVFVAVAAGNYAKDACLSSPARAAGTFTVAASTAADGRRLDSNWGTCVDAYAPGDQILSAGLTTYSAIMSGTSMAAPHVAGVAALYKQAYGNVASATLVAALKSWSTTNIISSGSYGSTPNRLLYKGGL